MSPKVGRKSTERHVSGRTVWGAATAFAVALMAPERALAAPAFGVDFSWLSTATTLGGVSLALAAGLWALAEHRAAAALRRSMKTTRALLRAAVGERDALLGAGREALLVWGRDRDMVLTFGGSE